MLARKKKKDSPEKYCKPSTFIHIHKIIAACSSIVINQTQQLLSLNNSIQHNNSKKHAQLWHISRLGELKLALFIMWHTHNYEYRRHAILFSQECMQESVMPGKGGRLHSSTEGPEGSGRVHIIYVPTHP